VISQEDALRIAAEHFPAGPESLVERLGAEVHYVPLVGADGWCVQGVRTIIRVNSNSAASRQRFTLAHELAHLILGTEPDIALQPFQSDREEERTADRLASELLIPPEQIEKHLRGHVPVDARSLKRLAKASNVSPVMAACRVVSATEQLGLENAAVVFFTGGREQWRYSYGLRFDAESAQATYEVAMDAKPDLIRQNNSDGNIVVGSIIDAHQYQVLLVQLLAAEKATQETYEERLSQLGQVLFAGDHSFRQSIAASLGIIKGKCAGQSLEQACDFFYGNYPDKKYKDGKAQKLKSDAGRRYIRLYLERWFG
jgi:hypothetical protein